MLKCKNNLELEKHMNCQNAQSMVLNFINNKLDKEETKEFITICLIRNQFRKIGT